MVDTFYLHLEFKNKNDDWSINLPFLCNKCGVCCTLEDFLTAGEIRGNPEEHPEVHAKMEALKKELGRMFEADEAEYEDHIMHTPCPFLVNNACSIYEIRPEGCRLFPKTAFGLLTQDCEPLNRFKKQRLVLKKGRACKETCHFTDLNLPIELSKYTEKQYQACIAKLRQAGITDGELAFFNDFNER